MSIPDYQSIMLPLLEIAADGKTHQISEAIEYLGKRFKLTPKEKDELLPSGKQEIFNNRVGWARTYLKKAVLLKTNERGRFCITERGLDVLKNVTTRHLTRIDQKYLSQFPEFLEFKAKHKEKEREAPALEHEPPKEQIEYAYEQLVEELEGDILQQLKSVSANRFEHIVIDLLVAMGYGGNRQDAAKAIGKSRDEGLDGVINEDKLGISKIYVQAKRWGDKNVRHKDIRNFIGSLDVAHADKGVFITTSDFNRDAEEAAGKSSKKIITIKGTRLAELMIENDIGVSRENEFVIKRLDTDYFED
ncbi:MAG: restriction endonuclease [Dehalococcoidia bacterium]|nr:MAG: restriction endonuclease [Dehalococcoidia bacterium]